MPSRPQSATALADVTRNKVEPGAPSLEQIRPSMSAIHAIEASRITIASSCPAKYIPQIAMPIADTRAEPTLITGQAALETAICFGKPNIRRAASGPCMKGIVPPMVMVVARSRGGMCLRVKSSNMVPGM